MKKLLQILISLLLTTASFAQDFSVEGLNYIVTSNDPNEVQLIGGTPTTTNLIIPENVSDGVETYNVVSIANAAFEGAGLTGVSFPSTLRDLGQVTFRVNRITEVVIPEGITEIPQRCFSNNDLRSITLPESLETIGFRSFEQNELESIILPANVNSISQLGFFGNPLDSINLLAPVPPAIAINTSNNRDSFDNEVTIALNVPVSSEEAYIDSQWGAFKTINGLVQPIVGNTFTEGGLNYNITSIAPNEVAVTGGNSPNSLVIPESVNNRVEYTVTTISSNAFRGGEMTSVSIPASIESIGDNAFRESTLLTEVISNNTTAPTLGNNVFANTPNDVKLIIPDGSEQSYEIAGWSSNFFAVNGNPLVGETINFNGFTYSVISSNPNQVSLTDGNQAEGAITIPQSITPDNLNTATVTSISSNAFRDNELASVIIPESILSIGDNAFNGNEGLVSVTSNKTTAPTLGSNVFANTASEKALIIPDGSIAIYEEEGWNDLFTSINGIALDLTFSVDGLIYELASLTPKEVELTGGTPPTTDLVIPASVSDGENTFSVVSVGDGAFDGAGLTSVIFPNTLRTLGTSSFRLNSITEVVIPEGVTSIPNRCFFSNDITSISLPESLVTLDFRALERNDLESITLPQNVSLISVLALGVNPLTSITSLNPFAPNIILGERDDSLDNEGNIDLFIPSSAAQFYEEAGWVGFKSVNEIEPVQITLQLKAFLQGAYINPNTAEVDLMRDDLREARLFPQESPYEDARPVNDSIVFFSAGENAMVDWVFVELIDADDSATVLDSRSLIILRNGEIKDHHIVDLDIFNPVFDSPTAENYFIRIKHRNHISIRTANAISSDQSFVDLDFTNDPTLVEGGENALVEVSDNIFAMIAGDFDENGQIQPSDVNDTTADIGTSAYSNADMDMNGQIQPADVNNLVNPNVGRGVQFAN